jgi:hypothetical protein
MKKGKKEYETLGHLSKDDPDYLRAVEELVSKVKSAPSELSEERNQNIEAFLTTFQIKSGTSKIRANWIYHLYTTLAKESALSYSSFFKAFSPKFPSRHTKYGRVYLLNKEPFTYYFELNKDKQHSIGKPIYEKTGSKIIEKLQEDESSGQET